MGKLTPLHTMPRKPLDVAQAEIEAEVTKQREKELARQRAAFARDAEDKAEVDAEHNALEQEFQTPDNKCGHINADWTGADDMTCQLSKGHEGKHQAPYLRAGEKATAVWGDSVGAGK